MSSGVDRDGLRAQVFGVDEQSEQPVEVARWVALAEAVLDDEGVHDDAELSLLFVDETAMADLNERFMGEAGPTDVLAFPIDEHPHQRGRHPDAGTTGPARDRELEVDLPVVLGDVVVCPAVAARQAPEHASTYEDEVALLVVHGILHVLGHDHAHDGEATRMRDRERELLLRHHRR